MPKSNEYTLSLPISAAARLPQLQGGPAPGTGAYNDTIKGVIRQQFDSIRPRPRINVDAQTITVVFARELETDQMLSLLTRIRASWRGGQETEASLALALLASVPTDRCRSLAETLLETGNYQVAESFLTVQAAADTSKFRTNYLASAHFLSGRLAEAEALFSQAHTDPPDYFIMDLQAATGLGICRLLRGDAQGAAQLLQKAVGQAGGARWSHDQGVNLVTRLNLARVLRLIGDKAQAATQYGELLRRVPPGDPGGWNAAVLEEQKRLNEKPVLHPVIGPTWCMLHVIDLAHRSGGARDNAEARRDEFLKHLVQSLEYWRDLPLSEEEPAKLQRRLSGFAFTVLSALDGVNLAVPGRYIVAKQADNEGLKVENDIGGDLHDHWHEALDKYLGSRPSDETESSAA